MSRQVDLTKKLSNEDREYLASRSRDYDIARADAIAAGEEFTVPAPVDPMVAPRPSGDTVKSENPEGHIVATEAAHSEEAVQGDKDELTVEELQAILKSKGLPVSGKKDELIARLNEAD